MPNTDTTSRAVERRALNALSAPGAVLVTAAAADSGGVFTGEGGARPVARVSKDAVSEWLTRDWLAREPADPEKPSITRYRLSDAGRKALTRRKSTDAVRNPAESVDQAQHREYARVTIAPDARTPDAPTRVDIRVNVRESPLAWLARRKDATGAAFLTSAEVEAGERLRLDFEAAQLGPRMAQDWTRFLAVVDEGARGSGALPLGVGAAERVSAALRALGPGLADAALRVCCFVEGLETMERALGWSSRSGKVVLKIALQRLVAHYGLEAKGPDRHAIEVWRGD